MKRKILLLRLAIALIIVAISIMQGCIKKEDHPEDNNDCQICTATKNGSTVATETECSQQDKDNFKSKHTDATVSCY